MRFGEQVNPDRTAKISLNDEGAKGIESVALIPENKVIHNFDLDEKPNSG